MGVWIKKSIILEYESRLEARGLISRGPEVEKTPTYDHDNRLKIHILLSKDIIISKNSSSTYTAMHLQKLWRLQIYTQVYHVYHTQVYQKYIRNYGILFLIFFSSRISPLSFLKKYQR